MILLTAGHTGPDTGAQCAATHFDEGAENIWLRNRIAQILTNKYGLVVLIDQDKATLQLLIKELNTPTPSDTVQSSDTVRQVLPRPTTPTAPKSVESVEQCFRHSLKRANQEEKKEGKSEISVLSVGAKTSRSDKNSVHSVRDEKISVSSEDIVIDLHFNAHSNPQARGTEVIVADDATTLELRWAARIAHATSDALGIPLRSIKTESQTPHHRLGMLHLTPQSIILEVCFSTSPDDVAAYRKNREHLAETLAHNIAQLLR